MLPAIDMLNHAREGTATSLVVERAEESCEEAEGCGGEGGVQGGRSGGTLVFSMEAERDIAAGEELTHMYDHFDDAQLLLTYGFISEAGEGALPTTARLPLQMIANAAAAVRDGSGDGALRWDAADGWSAKLAAVEQLLTPHGGKVGVSVDEPLPDELVTAALLLMVRRHPLHAATCRDVQLRAVACLDIAADHGETPPAADGNSLVGR